MINLDDRILDSVDADELYLLCHIAKRMDKAGKSFPSITLLRKETKFGKQKMQNILNSLTAKGMMKREQITQKRGQFSTNRYIVLTEMISVFVSIKGAGVEDSPQPDFRDTVRPDTVRPSTEKPPTKYYSYSTTTTTAAPEIFEKVHREPENPPLGKPNPPLSAPPPEKIPAVNVQTLITAISATPDSAHLLQARALCQQRGWDYESQLRDYALAILNEVAEPITLHAASEFRKRFWMSVKNYSPKKNLPNGNEKSTPNPPSGRKPHSAIVAERLKNYTG